MSSISDYVMSVIPEKVRNAVEARFNSLRNFIMTMCISDIGISQDKENAQEVQALLNNGLYIEWHDDMHCQIGVRLPDIISDKARELVEFCLHTGKQYVFG